MLQGIYRQMGGNALNLRAFDKLRLRAFDKPRLRPFDKLRLRRTGATFQNQNLPCGLMPVCLC